MMRSDSSSLQQISKQAYGNNPSRFRFILPSVTPARALPAHPPGWPGRWLIASVLLTIALGCMVLTAVVGAGLAVRRGAITGPDVDLRLGSVRIVAVTNAYPDCNPRLEGCQVDFIHPRAGLPRYYTVWVVTHRQTPGPGGMQDQFGSQRLLKIQTSP